MTAERSVSLPQSAPALTAEERLLRYEALSRALESVRSVSDVADVTAREACLALGAIAAIVMAASEDGSTLLLVGHHGVPADRASQFQSLAIDSGFPICRAFATGKAEWFDEEKQYTTRYGEVANTYLPQAYTQAVASVPLAVEGRVVLGVGLSFAQGRIPPESDRVFAQRLLHLCAQAFERARLYEQEHGARASAEPLGVVLEAGDAVARAGDRETILSRLVDVVVPRLADWCSVWLLDDGKATLAALRHVGVDLSADVQAIVARSPVTLDALRGVGAVLRTGVTERLEIVDAAALSAFTQEPDRRAFFERIGVRSLLIVPLLAGERILGAVTLISTRPELRYDAAVARLAEKLASRAAFALDSARLIGELRQHADTERRAREVAQRAALRMRILAEASRAFSEARLDVHLISTSLATLVSAYLGDGCTVMLVSDDGSRLDMIAMRHASADQQRIMTELAENVELRVGEGVMGAVVASGEPVVVSAADPGFVDRIHPGARAQLERLGLSSLAGVPLRLGGRVIGALGASRTQGAAFDADDLAILQDLADRAAIALANARLHAAEQVARRHVERLQSVTSALGEAVTPEQVADVILDSVMQELGGDLALFYEPSEDARHLLAKRARNIGPELLGSAERVPVDRAGIVPEAFRTRAPFFIEAIDDYRERFPSVTVAGPWMKLGAFAVLPLVVGAGVVYGVVAVAFRTARTFSAVDRAFAMNLAEQSAQALERARLYAAERAAKREAETASRLKDEFLATVSHELRTPLNAILGWASLLRSGRLEPDALDRAIATIERNARTQARLVDDVLDVSRIISGKLTIRAEAVDVAIVLQQALDVVRPAALAKGVAIETNFQTGLSVRGDADRLQQVFWNVLFNAVKFTPRGGRIRVTADFVEDGVRVSVTDSGQGVGAEFLPYLFEPFRQADGSTTRTHGGLGLGLSIAKRLVQLHGGEIHAASEGAGRGATFTIALPATEDVPSVGAAGRSRPAARLRGVDILVVDDDEDARELTAMVLSGEGAEVRTASSARLAITAMQERTPAILVCDIGMPEEDGLSFLPRARAVAADRGEEFPALAFTAYADAEHVELVARAGFDAHLTKPVDAHALVSAVARLAVPIPEPTSSSVVPRG